MKKKLRPFLRPTENRQNKIGQAVSEEFGYKHLLTCELYVLEREIR